MSKTTASAMTDTDLPTVVDPVQAQNKRDIPNCSRAC